MWDKGNGRFSGAGTFFQEKDEIEQREESDVQLRRFAVMRGEFALRKPLINTTEL